MRTAHAVGLVDEIPEAGEVTYQQIRRTVLRVREAGIAARAAADVAAAGPDETMLVAGRLREILRLLEESPLPDTEWRRVLQISSLASGTCPLARIGNGDIGGNGRERKSRSHGETE